jgi:hypothetical protein
MMFLAALLLRLWLVRITRAPLAERVHRLEVLFWLVVISASLAVLTASVLQMTMAPPVLEPPRAEGHASV